MKATARLLLLCTAASTALAQGPGGAPAIRSVEVHPDRTVTFRLPAPEATDVKVSGNFLPAPQALKKDEKGEWSATVGPLDAQIYHYAFVVNGLRVIDPN